MQKRPASGSSFAVDEATPRKNMVWRLKMGASLGLRWCWYTVVFNGFWCFSNGTNGRFPSRFWLLPHCWSPISKGTKFEKGGFLRLEHAPRWFHHHHVYVVAHPRESDWCVEGRVSDLFVDFYGVWAWIAWEHVDIYNLIGIFKPSFELMHHEDLIKRRLLAFFGLNHLKPISLSLCPLICLNMFWSTLNVSLQIHRSYWKKLEGTKSPCLVDCVHRELNPHWSLWIGQEETSRVGSNICTNGYLEDPQLVSSGKKVEKQTDMNIIFLMVCFLTHRSACLIHSSKQFALGTPAEPASRSVWGLFCLNRHSVGWIDQDLSGLIIDHVDYRL